MAHNISRETFFDTTGVPAWHRLSIFEKLGIVKEDREYTAKEVYALFGNPEHSLAQLSITMPDGSLQSLEQFMILRHPVADDPQFRQLGIVSKNYELTDAGFASDLWDKHIGLPVDTMMMLQNDGVLVITAKMPDYDIKGEGVKNHLIFQNGMNGRISVRSDISATRVVCNNTLNIAQSYSVNHTEGSVDRVIAWMGDLVERSRFQVDVMREVYEALAETPATSEIVRKVADKVYIVPKKPNANFGYANGLERAVEDWQKYANRIEEMKSGIVMQFTQGTGAGFDDEDCKTRGTLWHGMNLFTENETHRRTNNSNSRAASLLLGQRLGLIQRATGLFMKESPRAMEAYSQALKDYRGKFVNAKPEKVLVNV